MTPEDAQPNQGNKQASSARPGRNSSREKWVLTTDALNTLLTSFSPNHDEAGLQYESMRSRLVRFFQWRCCLLAEDLADETINRVARRLHEGENIFNLPAYFLSVARLIFMESLRDREQVPLEQIPEMPAEQPFQDEQREARLRCLDHCLNKLPVDQKTLILTYHQEERQEKITKRKQLADGLGIPLNALRIRAHRIRLALEQCVMECLAG